MNPTTDALFLIGYRATGKTSVGRELARRLGRRFVDTDARVESTAGASIADIFRREGEPRFRDLESAVLRSIVDEIAAESTSAESIVGFVVSTGGGIVLRGENVDVMRAAGAVVWLRARVETIRARLGEDSRTAATRPGLTGVSAVDEVEDVLARRRAIYEASSHHAFDTDELGPNELASAIAHWFETGRETEENE